MILTRAIIIKKINDTNKYLIDIPSFAKANSVQQYQVEALVCYQPGCIPGYMPGDAVFVQFEGFNKSHPVIMGKMYTGDTKYDRINITANNLTVKETASLTDNTYINSMKLLELATKINSLSAEKVESDASLKEELSKLQLTVVKLADKLAKL